MAEAQFLQGHLTDAAVNINVLRQRAYPITLHMDRLQGIGYHA